MHAAIDEDEIALHRKRRHGRHAGEVARAQNLAVFLSEKFSNLLFEAAMVGSRTIGEARARRAAAPA